MNDIVIKAENLGKQYVIGHQAEKGSYLSLRDVLMQDARTLVENLLRQDLTSIEEAEALKSLMDEQKYTQEQLGGIIGKAQGKMRDCANTVRHGYCRLL